MYRQKISNPFLWPQRQKAHPCALQHNTRPPTTTTTVLTRRAQHTPPPGGVHAAAAAAATRLKQKNGRQMLRRSPCPADGQDSRSEPRPVFLACPRCSPAFFVCFGTRTDSSTDDKYLIVLSLRPADPAPKRRKRGVSACRCQERNKIRHSKKTKEGKGETEGEGIFMLVGVL